MKLNLSSHESRHFNHASPQIEDFRLWVELPNLNERLQMIRSFAICHFHTFSIEDKIFRYDFINTFVFFGFNCCKGSDLERLQLDHVIT